MGKGKKKKEKPRLTKSRIQERALRKEKGILTGNAVRIEPSFF